MLAGYMMLNHCALGMPPHGRSTRWQYLSPSLPLTQRVHIGDEVLAYPENLLPEGDLRQGLELAERMPVAFDSSKPQPVRPLTRASACSNCM